MGFTKSDVEFLFYCKKSGVSFESTLTLGRQFLYADKETIKACIDRYKCNTKGLNEVEFKDIYTEPLLELLGGKKIDSIDNSSYENATIIHDLNTPINNVLKNRFSAVIDGGTIEHVFNFPLAIKNCMEMLKVGGHYLGFTPANNSMGHGFYQFSPELLFRVFDEMNGFKIKHVIISAGGSFYEVTDPVIVKQRVELTNSQPAHLIVLAEKIEEKEIFKTTPQQSDYAYNWEVSQAISEGGSYEKDSSVTKLYRKLPLYIRKPIRQTYDLFNNKQIEVEGLGIVNAAHYKKLNWPL